MCSQDIRIRRIQIKKKKKVVHGTYRIGTGMWSTETSST